MKIKNKITSKNNVLIVMAVLLMFSVATYSRTMEESSFLNKTSNKKGGTELLPDLTPHSPRDIVVAQSGSNIFLRFATSYYNHGDGPLEFFGVPEVTITQNPDEHAVMQRIYAKDGTYREIPVGVFTWHEEHGHYHFTDFFIYELRDTNSEASARTKTGFCVRDIEQVKDVDIPSFAENAVYSECDTEKQGISVGWSDVYHYNFADQWIDITNLSSGTYTLSFTLNPEQIFKEKSYSNNTSSVLLDIDMETLTVSVQN